MNCHLVLFLVLPVLSLGQQSQPAGWMSLHDGHHHILAQATVDGESGIFVIDTGSSNTLFTPSFGQKLNLGERVSLAVATGGVVQRSNVPIYGPKKIFLENGFTLQPASVGICELTTSRDLTGVDIVGLLGLDALKESVLELDFQNYRFRVSGELSSDFKQSESKFVRRRRPGGLFVLDAEVAGVDLDLTLDTGSNGHLSVDEDAFRQFEDKKMLGKVRASSTKTTFNQFKSRSSSFVGGELLTRPLCGIPVRSEQNHGHIGLSFMRCFRMALDVANSRLHYELRTDGYKGLLVPEIMCGALFWHRKEGTVVYLFDTTYPNSPIKKTGAQRGDVVAQFGDYTGNAITAEAVYRVCSKHAGQAVPLKLVRNGVAVYSGTLQLRERAYEFDSN